MNYVILYNIIFVTPPTILKTNAFCFTHQTRRCVCLVFVHLGNQAWICSSVCVRCRHDACAPTLRGSHVHCRSLTRMLRTHPTQSIKTHYSSHCISFTGNAHHKKKVNISLIPSAMFICYMHTWEQQKKPLLSRSSIMEPQNGQLCS